MSTDNAPSACPFAHEREEAPFPWFSSEECPLAPAPQLAKARAEGPVTRVTTWDGSPAWIVTRMEEVKELLTSPHFSASPETPGYPSVTAARAAQSKSYQTFITMDPPDHGAYRRMLTKEFMMKRMEALRPFIQRTFDELLDKMEQRGAPADFIEDVALPFPSQVISIMLGVPYEDHAKLQEWSRHRMSLAISPEVLSDSARKMGDYISQLLREKERDPGDGEDLLSRLAAEWINPGKLSHQDAVQMGSLLYVAGHETTANQIGLGILSLLQNPEQKAALMADSSLVRNAVEEILRFHSITHMNSARVATADVVIGGQLIRKGEGVFALVQAANHDPAVFPEPERFDIHRDMKSHSHVAFSFGIHQCLGQPLARLEVQIAVETVFRRFPNLRLAVPFEEIKFKPNNNVRGLVAMPVSW